LPDMIAMPRTISLLHQCWSEAESRVRDNVAKKFDVHHEVFITRLWYGELKLRLVELSDHGDCERTFAEALGEASE